MRVKALGLVAAGKFADSPVCRLLAMAEQLGPVKAPSVRVASRIANTLRAGYPVRACHEFQNCRLILISVPDSLVASTVAELSSQELNWNRKVVILCSSRLGADDLGPLAQRGAEVGSLSVIPGFEERWLLLEGNKAVELQTGKCIGLGSRRITVIRPGLKPFYLAALACTGEMVIPLLIAAGESLGQAGVSSAHAMTIIQKQMENSVRSYSQAGRKAYRGDRQAPALSKRVSAAYAPLAKYLDESARAATLLPKK